MLSIILVSYMICMGIFTTNAQFKQCLNAGITGKKLF